MIKRRLDYTAKLLLSAVADCDGKHNEAILQKVKVSIEQLESIKKELEKLHSSL